MHYAFNHREAIRAFRHAADLDPAAPMPWWGVALSLGPNINAPMSDDAVAEAWNAIQRAREPASNGSAAELAWIEALATRYAPHPAADRSAPDRDYALAMRALAERFPRDPDALTLYAEALMCSAPWNYWTDDAQPAPGLEPLVPTLEHALALNPDHPGANHLLIHAVEAGPEPRRGLPSADRLRDLVPVAGHLVHMPSHIYLRLGLYAEGSRANELAIRADQDYIAQCGA